MKKYLVAAKNRKIVYEENMVYVNRIINGIKGEEEVARWIETHTSIKVRCLRNLYLKSGSHGEADFIIFSKGQWILLEVKNYVGSVEIDRNNCSLNGKIIDGHPIHQLRKIHNIVQGIAREVNPYVEVKSFVVFINEHSNLKMSADVEGMIITRGQLRYFLKGIETNFSRQWLSNNDFRAIEESLKNYHYPAPLIDLSLDWDNLTPGVTCPECLTLDVDTKRRHVICRHCNIISSKKKLVFHTISEYCSLKLESIFTIREIVDYMDNRISRFTVSKYAREMYPLYDNYTKKCYKYIDY